MLPKEYQEVEYLESTGTQYLNTGVSLDNDLVITCDYSFTESKNSWRRLFGWLVTGWADSYSFCYKTNNSKAPRIVTGPNGEVVLGGYQTGRYTVSLSTNGHVSVYGDNGYNQSRDITPCTVTSKSRPIYLYNFGGTNLVDYAVCKVYSFLISSTNDVAMCSLVPCYRKSDNKSGMYDTVRGMFLTNQGTGEFICGPAVYNALLRETNGLELARRRTMLLSKVSNSLLPYEYQQAEYLETDGNQYIDTGLVPENGFGFFIDLMPLTNVDTTSASCKAMGATKRNGGFWGGVEISTYATTNGGQMTWFAKNKWYDPGFKSYTRVQLSNINNHYYSSTGKDYQTPYITASEIYGTLYLLSINNDQGVIPGAGSRLWLCKLYNNDDVVANLVPCYRKADEKPGMYDTVRKIFLTNQGTNEFDIGPEIHGTDDIHPGTLKYWWSGKNAPYDNHWSERLSHGTHVMFLYNEYVYLYDNQYYEFSYNGGYGSRTLNDMQFDIGNHWRFVFDIGIDHAETNSTFVDIGSVAAANHAIGFGIFPGRISVNWKLNGNNSNPGISNLSHPGIPADNGFNRMRGYFEINDGGDGYDRLSVMVNKKLVTYDVKIPQVHYGPSWDRNLLLFGRGHTNGYYAKCRIYDLRFYVID